MTPLVTRLMPHESDRRAAGAVVARATSLAEFAAVVLANASKVPFADAIAAALPWAEALGQAAGAVLPPVKALLAVLERATTETDPEVLLHVACNLAWQQALAGAVAALDDAERLALGSVGAEMGAALDVLREQDGRRLDDLSFDTALDHPWLRGADAWLEALATGAGLNGAARRRLVDGVHRRFVPGLKALLAHPHARQRMAPAAALLQLGTDERASWVALDAHASWLLRQFRDRPVFGGEPFALCDLFIEPRCTPVAWGLEDAPDPDDSQPLLQTVLDLLAEPRLRAVVLQGPAGSGKSAFTLRLCDALSGAGLRPIRVRMRDLRLDVHLREALPQAVALGDPADPSRPARPADLFLGGRLFHETVPFGATRICPWILVLDGWDELSLGASVRFRERLAQLLAELRWEYLQGGTVRVVLTGRPTPELVESAFIQPDTAVLQLHPWTPAQLQAFVNRLALASRQPRFITDDPWPRFQPARFDRVVARYAEAPRGRLEVLGLPLLAAVAMRLLVRWRGDIERLLDDPTTLHRHLVDHACRAANASDGEELAGSVRLSGPELRNLLHRTAAALTVLGREHLTFDELQRWLDMPEPTLRAETDRAAENPLARMVVSFYFAGTASRRREPGCEFLHKSFREYLFAEAVVEALKEGVGARPQRRDRAYGEDFHPRDPRHAHSRRLARLLAPRWLGPETCGHLERLVRWELRRSTLKPPPARRGLPTRRLTTEDWCRLRDDLADLWEWWAEGAHLRCRPEGGGWGSPAVVDFARYQPEQLPPRTLTLDAHLGDGLFRLAALVHRHVAEAEGWLGDGDSPRPGALWADAEPGDRPRQTRVQGRFVLFAPARKRERYFANDVARIDAGAERPDGGFPRGVDATGVDLSGTRLAVPFPGWQQEHTTPAERRGTPEWRSPTTTSLRHANLTGARLQGAWFVDTDLRGVLARETELPDAHLAGSCLVGADLRGARLGRATLRGADLAEACLDAANLVEVDAEGASLRGASLRGAQLGRARFGEARLVGAVLDGCSAEGLSAPHADLTGASLRRADLSRADLRDAVLAGADLDGAVLHDTLLDGVSYGPSTEVP